MRNFPAIVNNVSGFINPFSTTKTGSLTQQPVFPSEKPQTWIDMWMTFNLVLNWERSMFRKILNLPTLIQYKTFKRVCYCWTSGKDWCINYKTDKRSTERATTKEPPDMKISTGRFFTMKGNCLLSDIDVFITRHRITIEGKLKKLD